MLTYDELISRSERGVKAALAERDAKQEALMKMRSDIAGGAEVSPEDVTAAIAARDEAADVLAARESELATLRAEQAEDDRIAELREQPSIPTGVERRAYDQVARVGQEARTYNLDADRTGAGFLSDVLRSQLLGDIDAQQRLGRHMSEERVERGAYMQRAATGTSNFAGLVVPQYLTDLVAPYAKAARPFADAIRNAPLPADGMTVNISRITTATSVAVQTQGTDVSETNIDDTILTVNVLTNAGSQTVTRQAAERGTGVLDVVLEDLLTSYHTNLDNELLNQATNGLATVATAITWTDNTDPTAIELWPKIWQGQGAVESALKNQASGNVICVMHPRRWAWMNASLTSSNPLLAQVGAGVQGGADYQARYGSGFRGTIGGIPVVVDANVVTNLGASTNQDEVYILAANESFLWEDPSAPLFIRTDTGPSVKSLGVDLVVYGYFAMTHGRYSGSSQRITGSGLVTPAF